MQPRARFVLSFAILFTVAAGPLSAQQRRPITQNDLYAFKWAADPQISPDGRQVAYILVEVNAKKDGYNTGIWTVPTDGGTAPRRLTAGVHDGAPRWSP